MSMKRYGWMLFLAMVASALATPARAQGDEAAELAKKLANPVASLISVVGVARRTTRRVIRRSTIYATEAYC